MAGVEITETFNYDVQGVQFSAPFPYPFVAGNPDTGFGLAVIHTFEDTWIIGDLTVPALALGGFFPGSTVLCAFAADDEELACVTAFAPPPPGSDGFVGIVSDSPIHSFTFASGSSSETIHSVEFSPVPEPGTLSLLGLGSGIVLLVRRRVRRRPA